MNRKPRRSSPVTAALTAMGFAFVLSACGGGDGQTPQTIPGDAPPPAMQESPGTMQDRGMQDQGGIQDPTMQDDTGFPADRQGVDDPQGFGGQQQ